MRDGNLNRWMTATVSGLIHRVRRATTVRFAAVGLVNTAVDFGTFIALWAVHPPHHDLWLAGGYSVLGWMAGSIAGYLLHSRVTFRTRLPVGGFYGVSVLGVSVQAGSTSLMARLAGDSGAVFGKLLGIFLGSSVTYAGYRWLARRAATRRASPVPASTGEV